MDRKEFLKKGLLGTGIFALSGAASSLIKNDIDELRALEPIGFNHLPNSNSTIMDNMVFHKADSRGLADHGWLKSRHTFSFANYYNPERMHFGVLRVLNDDVVAGGRGFSTHPHDNMEIISIPLKGDLEHKDNMGNVTVIRNGDVQVMSAGTGIKHSEYNKNKEEAVEFLQIWLFPNKKNVTPRYDQMTLKAGDRKNKLQTIINPYQKGNGVWIQQDAWFLLGDLDAGITVNHNILKSGNGVYVFVLSGSVKVNGQIMQKRDGLGIWDLTNLEISAVSNSEILVMEVPMST